MKAARERQPDRLHGSRWAEGVSRMTIPQRAVTMPYRQLEAMWDDCGVEHMLPAPIAAEVRLLPEFRMGVHRIGVQLTDGMRIDDVLVSGGRVTKILGGDHVTFRADEVTEVIDQSERPLPPGI